MIAYFIGVDGGGTGTRVRLAGADGVELAQGQGGPSGLSHGIDSAWHAIGDAAAMAFAQAGIAQPPLAAIAIGLGLAGVHNKLWASQFAAANPGYGALRLENDGFTTLMGAHAGAAGTIVAIGTGSVGQALLPDGQQREVGGWGFPAGDEASGGWIGLRAINHIEQVIDGRKPASAFAQAVIDACGGSRDAIQVWLGKATQTSYAQLAPIVIAHAAGDDTARGFLLDAGREVASIAHALDPSGTLPLALCGGLGAPLRAYLPPELLARSVAPQGDAASGALRMIVLHVNQPPSVAEPRR
ncbi:MAG TPA: BadF/BadG/BcrA/BcrD ATPase family protein [Telluria sp.]|nr:BadF/BadG/BcrA/BcrD ATPase family protein [Telluria sp.]